MIIFSFLHICQSDYVAPVGVVVEHEHTASSTPIETRLAADGVAYSWAEFESYYFNADMAAEIWEALEVVAVPLSPLLIPAIFLSSWAPIIRIVARLSVFIPQ